jgi:hypothetical protein
MIHEDNNVPKKQYYCPRRLANWLRKLWRRGTYSGPTWPRDWWRGLGESAGKLPSSSWENLNPTLHTAWLNNHALTLKINIADVILVKNPVFYPYFPKNLL